MEYRLLIGDKEKMNVIGLCHNCLTSNVEIVDKHENLCADCWHKKFGKKQSQENKEIEPPTFEQLKKKLEGK